ncbi:MAG: hypothetical protein H6740_01320 [Alphaproteobacteria bacterium]|nr:hypothetical protein [Alphaproteobacteria bacterium]
MLARTEHLRGTAGFRTQVLSARPGARRRPRSAVPSPRGQRARSLAQIVRASPFEELHTLNLIALMLDAAVALKV